MKLSSYLSIKFSQLVIPKLLCQISIAILIFVLSFIEKSNDFNLNWKLFNTIIKTFHAFKSRLNIFKK